MTKKNYVVRLAKIISINGKVNLDKLEKIIELNEEFYNPKQ